MKKKLAQIALSAFLIFHVAAIFIFPNPESIIFRETENIFVDYGNALGINTTWRFFSPNPLIHLLEYETVSEENSDETYRYPESVSVEGSRESYNRKLNSAMFMMGKPEYMQSFLGPYLCKRHPKASALAFYSVSREFPTVESAKQFGSYREDLEKLTRGRVAQVECSPKGEP